MAVSRAKIHDLYSRSWPEMMVNWFKEHIDSIEAKRELPFFSRFARDELGTSGGQLTYIYSMGKQQKETGEVSKGVNDYRQFADAYEICKEIQLEVLVNGGLVQLFDRIVVLKSLDNVCGWRNFKPVETKQEGESTGSGFTPFKTSNKKAMDELYDVVGIDRPEGESDKSEDFAYSPSTKKALETLKEIKGASQ